MAGSFPLHLITADRPQFRLLLLRAPQIPSNDSDNASLCDFCFFFCQMLPAARPMRSPVWTPPWLSSNTMWSVEAPPEVLEGLTQLFQFLLLGGDHLPAGLAQTIQELERCRQQLADVTADRDLKAKKVCPIDLPPHCPGS